MLVLGRDGHRLRACRFKARRMDRDDLLDGLVEDEVIRYLEDRVPYRSNLSTGQENKGKTMSLLTLMPTS